MQHDSNRHPMPRHRRLKALAAIAALSLGSLALAGCGNDDELPPMEPADPPMEEPAHQEPIGDEPGMGDDPAFGDEPAMEDPGMADPMESQEPMMEEDEEPGSL